MNRDGLIPKQQNDEFLCVGILSVRQHLIQIIALQRKVNGVC